MRRVKGWAVAVVAVAVVVVALVVPAASVAVAPPLVTATMATLEQRVAALDEKTRKRLFSLCDWRAERAKTPKTALGVFQANGYPCPTAREPDAAGVFLKFSRFNHSCKPNAHHAWRKGERWIFATHDVAKSMFKLHAGRDEYIDGDELRPTRAQPARIPQRARRGAARARERRAASTHATG